MILWLHDDLVILREDLDHIAGPGSARPHWGQRSAEGRDEGRRGRGEEDQNGWEWAEARGDGQEWRVILMIILKHHPSSLLPPHFQLKKFWTMMLTKTSFPFQITLLVQRAKKSLNSRVRYSFKPWEICIAHGQRSSGADIQSYEREGGGGQDSRPRAWK
jgi:hypothetical protein